MTTTQTATLLEVQGTAIVLEFFLHLVTMEWILVVFVLYSVADRSFTADGGLL